MSQPEERCPQCGALVSGGWEGCQALLDEITLRAYNDLDYAAVRALAFDTYCMQHVERYCISAKSYAAHLTRLCCGLEFGGADPVYTAIQRWLSRNPPLEKPPILDLRGEITITSDHAAETGAEHRRLARMWAINVWSAYVSQHELARGWIKEALAER